MEIEVEIKSLQLSIRGKEDLADNEEFIGEIMEALDDLNGEIDDLIASKLSPGFRAGWTIVIT